MSKYSAKKRSTRTDGRKSSVRVVVEREGDGRIIDISDFKIQSVSDVVSLLMPCVSDKLLFRVKGIIWFNAKETLMLDGKRRNQSSLWISYLHIRKEFFRNQAIISEKATGLAHLVFPKSAQLWP